ncbi:MAG: FkbM family methyltransferase [Elusimicrobia bacterium]|nr:FkbM family methyltransferase [Elusimicrobiota bacterium]
MTPAAPRRLAAGFVKALLGRCGYAVVPAPSALTLEAALSRRAKAGARVGTVLDIGASDGLWSREALRHFPGAACLLVEANPVHAPALQAFKSSTDRVEVELAAAGDVDGELYFDGSDPAGGLAGHRPPAPGCLRVPAVRVDSLVRRKRPQPPFLLKLDTHGFEVPILEGAAETLNSASLLVIEVYNFKLTAGSLRFHEMCAFLEDRGWRPIDMCGVMHRPGDGSLWQMDLIFAPAADPAFRSNDYRCPP